MRARDGAVSRPAKVPRAPLVPPPIRIWLVPPGAGFGGSSAPGGGGSRSRAAVRGRELCSTVPRVQRARVAWRRNARPYLITGVKLRVNDEPGTEHVRGHLPCDPRYGRNPSPPDQNRCARSRPGGYSPALRGADGGCGICLCAPAASRMHELPLPPKRWCEPISAHIAAIQIRQGWSLRQAQLSWRAMDCGLSPDHYLQKRRLGSPGHHRSRCKTGQR
jgi:hypothetical protein